MNMNTNKKSPGYHEFNDGHLDGLEKTSPTANAERGNRSSTLSSIPIHEDNCAEISASIPVNDKSPKGDASSKEKIQTNAQPVPSEKASDLLLGKNGKPKSENTRSTQEKPIGETTRQSDVTGMSSSHTQTKEPELRAVFYGDGIDSEDSAHPPMTIQRKEALMYPGIKPEDRSLSDKEKAEACEREMRKIAHVEAQGNANISNFEPRSSGLFRASGYVIKAQSPKSNDKEKLGNLSPLSQPPQPEPREDSDMSNIYEVI